MSKPDSPIGVDLSPLATPTTDHPARGFDLEHQSMGRAYLILALGVVLAAGCLSAEVARRGFYAFDQSILFDGAYRVYRGQVPYRDFVVPFGPVPLFTTSIFFAIFGPTYLSYVLAAAAIGASATALSMVLLATLYKHSRWIVLLTGAITATWFSAQAGTPWMEQIAFLFALSGIVLLLQTLSSWRPPILTVCASLSGASAVLSFLSKQNAGLVVAPAYLCVFFALASNRSRVSWMRLLLAFAGGMALICVITLLWLCFVSDLQGFWTFAITIPSQFGRQRLAGITERIYQWFSFTEPIPMLLRTAVAIIVGSLAAYLMILLRRRPARLSPLPPWLGLALAAAQGAFHLTANYSVLNAMPFLGVLWGISTADANTAYASARRRGVWLLIGLLIFTGGCWTALTRQVYRHAFPAAHFDTALTIPALRSLRWARPTLVEGTDVDAASLEDLHQFLRARGDAFFIFPDFTLMYAALRTNPPQPLVWFHKGLTYPRVYDRSLDERIVESLKSHNVGTVVLEHPSLMGTTTRLKDFPLLASFVNERFRKTHVFGIFQVHERVLE